MKSMTGTKGMKKSKSWNGSNGLQRIICGAEQTNSALDRAMRSIRARKDPFDPYDPFNPFSKAFEVQRDDASSPTGPLHVLRSLHALHVPCFSESQPCIGINSGPPQNAWLADAALGT
jgi:hypothetical protein